jgi:ribosomal protein S18 acetylase RimI-like enzyme
MDVEIRSAVPVATEGELFARYLDIAGDGLLSWMFGKGFAGIVGRAFVERGHDLSYEHAWFAETEAGIAGMVSGFSASDHDRSEDGPLIRAAGLRSVRMFGTWLVAVRLLTFMDRVPEGDWYLQAVAVDQAHRGAGIGSLLLDHAEATAETAGAERLALDVDVDNDGARRLYERRGMAVDAPSPSIPLLGTAVYRMTKAL